MKSNGDLAQGWLRKAESDFSNAELCVNNSTALDTACFHCQQAAEKSLKAWLIRRDQNFPLTHDLKELVGLCAMHEPQFGDLVGDAEALNPYAVKGRYAADFWPSIDDAQAALEQARRIYQSVRDHWS